MKKMLFVLLVFVLLTTACTDSDSVYNADNPLVGTWESNYDHCIYTYTFNDDMTGTYSRLVVWQTPYECPIRYEFNDRTIIIYELDENGDVCNIDSETLQIFKNALIIDEIEYMRK